MYEVSPFTIVMTKAMTEVFVGSITSRCSGKEPALLPRRQRAAELQTTARDESHSLFAVVAT